MSFSSLETCVKCRWNFFTRELETSLRFFSFSAGTAVVAAAAAVAAAVDCSCFAVMLVAVLRDVGLMLRTLVVDPLGAIGFKDLQFKGGISY